MPDTPDQRVAELIAGATEGRIFRLTEERNTLLQAAARITEIDNEIAILQGEKSRVDGRRPTRSPPGGGSVVPGGGNQRAAVDSALLSEVASEEIPTRG